MTGWPCTFGWPGPPLPWVPTPWRSRMPSLPAVRPVTRSVRSSPAGSTERGFVSRMSRKAATEIGRSSRRVFGFFGPLPVLDDVAWPE
jgi:hypothetical protein